MTGSVKEYFVGSELKPVALENGKKIQLEAKASSKKTKK